MKKTFIILLSLLLSLNLFANLTQKERKELRKEFKLYKTERNGNQFLMKNKLAKREIVISNSLYNLPKSSSVAFGDKAWENNGEWETRKNKKNIQYMGIPHTSRRKAIKKIEDKYVVMFYPAVGNNDDMVEDTMERIENILKKY